MSVRKPGLKEVGMRALCTTIVSFVYVSACSFPPDGSSTELLEALSECPPSEPACILMTANLKESERYFDIEDHPVVLSADEKVQSRDYGYIEVGVTGRLNNGVSRRYRLRIPYPNDALNCNDSRLAALGARKNGGGVIATRQGTLEILTPDIIIGSWGTLGIIDQARKSISYSVAPDWDMAGWESSLAVTKTGDVVWRVRGRCLSLSTGGQFVTLRDEECSTVTLTPALDAEVKQVVDARIFSDAEAIERLAYDLWHADGAPNLVYIWGVACT
jgi:hypothetical protein